MGRAGYKILLEYYQTLNIITLSSLVYAEARNGVVVWNTETGRIQHKICESTLGAVVNNSILCRDDTVLGIYQGS